MDIGYRPARPEDLEPALRVVQDAYNELRLLHGLPPNIGVRPPSFQAFCLARDPDGLWVAEADGALVGFGFAWMRQTFWYLAQLFIRPGTQGKGIGQALLTRTMDWAAREGAENRALITMAYNTASTGLYLRNGLYPREPLLRMSAPVQAIAGGTSAEAFDTTLIEPWPVCREWLGRIDEEVLGFRREEHHAFLLGGSAARALRIERAGHPAGYAYISPEGHIGPLAVAPSADPAAVVDAAVRCALRQEQAKQVSMIVPGKADRILATASGLGFRIEEPFVLLSAKPFGDWRHYLPSNPGFM
jgi:GNAT superfamily N-acetyltransferase